MDEEQTPHGIESTARTRSQDLPVALRTTSLGMYLITREARYLLAFIGQLFGCLAVVYLIIKIFFGAYSGSLFAPENGDYFDSVKMTLIVSAVSFAIGNFAQGKAGNGFKAALVAGFIYFLTTI